MSPSVTCYADGRKRKSRRLCEAFAAGCGGSVSVDATTLAPGAAAFYGVTPRTKSLFDAARCDGRDWFYIDNGYFGRSRFFRVTRNSVQFDGRDGPRSAARLRALGVTLVPWRRDGRHVLLCPQSSVYMSLVCDLDGATWLADCQARLRAATDRPIRVRRKDDRRPLAADLDDCWALVTHASNAAVEAVLAGVPVFVTGPSAAAAMGRRDLDSIECPAMPEGRRAWVERLAAAQWSLAEIRDGTAWNALQTGG